LSSGDVYIRVELERDELDLNRAASILSSLTSGRGAGSLVVFTGFVKGVVDGRRVFRLSYEAYEDLAVKVLEKIAREEASERGVYAVWIRHRLGDLKPGEPTLYVLVVAEPRSLAFRKASRILDRIKREVPIYKLESRDDGEYWILGESTRLKREVEAGTVDPQRQR